MRIKDGCKISISGRNKRRILLVVVILSIVALLTPVSLAATAGGSDIKITDQSVNTDKITAPLLNPASSALILSILGKEDTVDQRKIADQSVNTDKKEPTVAENDDKEPVKDTPPNKTPEGSSNDVANNNNGGNNYFSKPGSDFSTFNNLLGRLQGNTNANIDNTNYNSNGPSNFTIPGSLEVGDILIWDAGYRYEHGIYSFIPAIFSGHCAIYIGPRYNETTGNYLGNCVEAVPRGVGYNNINSSNYIGEHFFAVGRVKNATESQKHAAVNWTLGRVNRSYQRFWLPWIGPIKSSIPEGFIPPGDLNKRVDDNWYCSELVWAAYYNTSSGTIDIDEDGWGNTFPFLIPSVSPLEINDSENVDIVYSWPDGNGTTTVSLSVDSGSNSNSNTLIYSDSEGAALNYSNSVSNSNTLNYLSSSLNSNTLSNKLLNILKGD